MKKEHVQKLVVDLCKEENISLNVIGSIFESFAKCYENNSEINRELNEIAEAIYREYYEK